MLWNDEKILNDRKEQKRNRPPSLEEGYYINDEALQFSEKIICNRIKLYIPSSFIPMPFPIAQAKYPSAYRSSEIITNADMSADFSFQILTQLPKNVSILQMIEQCYEILKQNPSCICEDEIQNINPMTGYYMTFRNHTIDIDMCHMHMFLLLNHAILQTIFHCPYQEYKEWKRLALFVFQTIEEYAFECMSKQ